MTKKLQPKLRFKGFTDPWERRELGDLLAEPLSYGLNAKAIEYDGTHKYLRITDIDDNNRRYIDDPVSPDAPALGLAAYQLSDGDIVFARTGASVGKAYKYRQSDGDLYYAGFLIRARISDENNAGFIFNQTFTERYWQYVNITSQRSGQPGISAPEYSHYSFYIPSKTEQDKIAALLEKFDELIAAAERKVELLKQKKQAYLQQIFSQQLRFKGFTDPWEHHQFLDCIDSIIDFRGRTPKKLGMEWSAQGYLALSALNVKDGYIDASQDAHYGDENLYQKWMKGNELYAGQVLFTTEAPMGNVAQVPDDTGYILSQRTIAFVPNQSKISDNFLFVLLCAPEVVNKLNALSSGGTAKGVSQKSLSFLQITIPCSSQEQDKISYLFTILNKLIAAAEKEAALLRKKKQYYLQQLFV